MLDDITSVTLNTALSALAERQRISANNLANIETPNFTASQVSFESSLRDALAAGDPAQASVSITATTDPAGVNGNNVNLDTETLSDIDTGLRYQLALKAMDSQFSVMKTAIGS